MRHGRRDSRPTMPDAHSELSGTPRRKRVSSRAKAQGALAFDQSAFLAVAAGGSRTIAKFGHLDDDVWWSVNTTACRRYAILRKVLPSLPDAQTQKNFIGSEGDSASAITATFWSQSRETRTDRRRGRRFTRDVDHSRCVAARLACSSRCECAQLRRCHGSRAGELAIISPDASASLETAHAARKRHRAPVGGRCSQRRRAAETSRRCRRRQRRSRPRGQAIGVGADDRLPHPGKGNRRQGIYGASSCGRHGRGNSCRKPGPHACDR